MAAIANWDELPAAIEAGFAAMVMVGAAPVEDPELPEDPVPPADERLTCGEPHPQTNATASPRLKNLPNKALLIEPVAPRGRTGPSIKKLQPDSRFGGRSSPLY